MSYDDVKVCFQKGEFEATARRRRDYYYDDDDGMN
jgi:hypothetical protein